MIKNKNITIATLGSHSALDVCRGAKDEGFKTLVVCQKGREKTYTKYYKTQKLETPERRQDGLLSSGIGCVDEVILLDKFKDIISPQVQKKLLDQNAVFVPNRSFEVYINDYDAIENSFSVPMFGNKKLLRIEERGFKPNQYDLLDAANIRYPKQFKNPQDINRLCIIKVLEKERGFERAFFFAGSEADYLREASRLIEQKIITKEALKKSVIEEFISGVQVNFNFFYSSITDRLELLGTDTRRQTNLDGILRLTGNLQSKILEDNKIEIKYEEAGHIAVTILESILEDAYALGERFVAASKKFVSPGVIGPFALQSMIIPGPPKKEIIVFDVSPRMPGSPGIESTPYGKYLYGLPVSAGRRVAMEIKEAVKLNQLDKIIT